MAKMDNPQDKSPLKKPTRQFNTYIKYSGLAFQMILTCGLATWIGYKLDTYFRFKFPAFTLGLLLSSLIGIIYWLVVSVTKDSENEEKL